MALAKEKSDILRDKSTHERVKELQKGYMFHDTVLRHSMVAVSQWRWYITIL